MVENPSQDFVHTDAGFVELDHQGCSLLDALSFVEEQGRWLFDGLPMTGEHPARMEGCNATK